MVVVAWVSRHPPLPDQIFELKKRLGEDVEIVQISKTFRDVKEVYNDIKSCGAEYAIVVLPLSMISALTQYKDITWIWAEMEPVHDYSCPGEDLCLVFDSKRDVVLESPNFKRHLRFKEFRKIVKVEMVTEEWEGGE
ncbi:MAG: hypothetical protein J7L58_05805 [Thermoplasmata archaeon]|nr:hypothetical protein [Thermoplasmata archaeon]